MKRKHFDDHQALVANLVSMAAAQTAAIAEATVAGDQDDHDIEEMDTSQEKQKSDGDDSDQD